MTPRERAQIVVEQCMPLLTTENFLNWIEQAIIAAVEEEREACALIVDMEAGGLAALAKHLPTRMQIASVSNLADKIRARSDPDRL